MAGQFERSAKRCAGDWRGVFRGAMRPLAEGFPVADAPYVRLQHRLHGPEGFFPSALSVNMANDRKLLVGGESLR